MSPIARGVLAALLGFSLLQPVDSLDWRIQRAVQQSRRPVLEPLMRTASYGVGNRLTVLGALACIAIFGGPAGVATAGASLAVLVPVNVAVEALKLATVRTRPDRERNPANSSFPSGHAANAAALAVVLGRRWRRGIPAFVLLAALVAWSRIYLNRHFLSDVLFGVVLGVVTALLVLRWLGSRGWLWDSARSR